MLRDELLIVDLHSVVHDFGVQPFVIEVVLLSSRWKWFLVGEERVFGPPRESGSRWA